VLINFEYKVRSNAAQIYALILTKR